MKVEPKTKTDARERHVHFINAETAEILQKLADVHGSIPARVIEAMATTYGPALLREAGVK